MSHIVCAHMIVELAGGGNAVVQAAYTPDGQYLVTVSGTGVITFRDTETFQADGRPIVGAARSAGPSLGPYFTADARYMIVAPEGEARLWDLESREAVGGPIRSDLPGQDPLLSAGRWLTTLGEDTVTLWDLDLDAWPALACQAAGRNLTADEWERLGPANEPYRRTCDRWPSGADPTNEGESS